MRFADIPIRIKLIASSIIIGIIPLVVGGFYGDWLVTNSLIDKSFDKLFSIQSLRKKQVEASFKRSFDDLETLAASERLASMIQELEKYRQQAGIPSSSPFTVGTETYKNIAGKYQAAYQEYIETYGYHDLKVISSLSGHVMFTVTGESDLGANLVYGRYKDSAIATVWREVVNTGRVVVVDFSAYEPSDSMQSLFIATPIFNETGTIRSVVVLQLGPAFINTIMDGVDGMGTTGESYLIRWFERDQKFEFRSNMSTMGEGKYVIGHKMVNIPQYWNDAVGAEYNHGRDIYYDSVGKEVLVAFDSLDIPGVDWYMISKIDKAEVTAPLRKLLNQAIPVILVLFLFVIGCAWLFSRRIVQPVIADVQFAKAISEGNLDATITLEQKDELGVLATTLNEMAVNLREIDWLKRGKEGLDNDLRGEVELDSLGARFISFMVDHMESQLGVFYLFREGELELVASHAFTDRKGNFNRIKLGEGLVGQAALERRMIVFSHIDAEVPEYNYGVDQQPPCHFLVAPLIFEEKIVGAFLIGSFLPFSTLHRKFVEQNLESVAIFINMALSRKTIEELFGKAQAQQEQLLTANKSLESQTRALKKSETELQAQQEELRVTNEELEERTEALQESQEELQTQQEELRVTNEDLQERTETLEKQKAALRQKTAELVRAQKEVEKKAEELERGSKYKSEFLANMSHELRTPLNSILILSQILAANKDLNLNDKQVESARAIHSSGSELLSLINEILDLSKVEAGKIELYLEEVDLGKLVSDVKRLFVDIAADKGLAFNIKIEETLQRTLYTDDQRVQQILRNLLTNAFKFTSQGSVGLKVSRPPAELMASNKGDNQWVAFAVTDEGIGIPQKQQEEIFKAFQQADGSTSRTYGGTGLGLSISKELTRLLGGSIHLESREGEGSTFTLVLPIQPPGETGASPAGPPSPRKKDDVMATPGPGSRKPESQAAGTVPPETGGSNAEEKALLVIAADSADGEKLCVSARRHGFQCIVAESGEKGLHYADYHRPSAVLLSAKLPGIDGWEVLHRLKENPGLRHIPVAVIAETGSCLKALQLGAIASIPMPLTARSVEEVMARIDGAVAKSVRKLLVVEDDKVQAESIKTLVGNGDVETQIVRTGEQALREVQSGEYDCMILDLGLPDMTGFELLDKINSDQSGGTVPVIVYTGRDLSREEEEKLRKFTETIIIKGVKSPERLLEESALFLHRSEDNLPRQHLEKFRRNHPKDGVFKDKTILVVDDDMRNVFALTNLLEEKGMMVVVARDGLESLGKLKEHREIDLVLMDIMMPNMDGFEAMIRIRENVRYERLPIIALTAKAMKGDRSKCIEAGANDYLAKPVNSDKLLSILKVWLY